MKKIFTLECALWAYVLFICCVVFGLTLDAGCGTNGPTKAAQAEAIVITTVNDAVKVLVPMINAGKLTQKQCDYFKSSYEGYYTAQQTARAAIEMWNTATNNVDATVQAANVDAANQAVKNAEASLITFANQMLKLQK